MRNISLARDSDQYINNSTIATTSCRFGVREDGDTINVPFIYWKDMCIGWKWMQPFSQDMFREDLFYIFILCSVCCCGVVIARYIAKDVSHRLSLRQKNCGNRRKEINAQLRKDKIDFIHRVGGYDVYGYASTPGGFIDDWRAKEFPSLIPPIPINDGSCYNRKKNDINTTRNQSLDVNEYEVYVDYAGAALPTQSQIKEIRQRSTLILGNPHSVGPAASRTQQYLEQVTKRILDHFQAHPSGPFGMKDNHPYPSPITATSKTIHPGYEILFTSGTTEAIRIIAEHFPWSSQQQQKHPTVSLYNRTSAANTSLLVYAQNSHTSVVGIREVALQCNPSTSIVCQPIDSLINTILHHDNYRSLDDRFRALSMKINDTRIPSKGRDGVTTNPHCSTMCPNCIKHLLVVPMECNFSGDRPDISTTFQRLRDIDSSTTGSTERILCEYCQQKDHNQSWYTLLDIAKAASTGSVNLCELNPDFAVASFYKMFGEPTGLGCLFVKRTAIDILFPTRNVTNNKFDDAKMAPTIRHHRLQRHYVGGGSVNIIVPGMDYTVSRSEPSPLVSLQRGTPHFRGIVALLAGFNEIDRVGGMERIWRHTHCLKQELIRRLLALRHGNGRNVIVIYGDKKNNTDDTSVKPIHSSGPIVAFNVVRADGTYVGYNEVSKLAALHRNPIQLRTGCFCNPGACQTALDLSDDDLIRNFEESGHVCGDPIDIIHSRPTGAIRISFGKDSTWEDMNALVAFFQQMFVSTALTSSHEVGTGCKRVPMKAVITELYIFPIKSCAAQRVSDWPMDQSCGRLRFDREFALVDASGAAMRLQMYPAMAQLRPEINLKALRLTINAPNPTFSSLSLDLEDTVCHDRQSSTVKVCGHRCCGVVWGDHAVAEWFSRYLGVRCWLARHTGTREGFYEHPKSVTSVSPYDTFPSLSFANEQPLLVISEHAVNLLNDAMKECSESKYSTTHNLVCSRQFRPNIVVRCDHDDFVDEEQQHVEDSWRQISMIDENQQKGMTFEVVGPCARCAMVDIDPMNGNKVGTLRTLATYRRNGNSQITFGIFVRASTKTEALARACTKDISNWIYIHEGSLLICD